MREQQPGALRVDGDGVVVVEAGALVRGEVHDVREVVGHAGEVSRRDVADDGRDPELVDPLTAPLLGEPGDAPHLVVGGQVPGERERDLPGRPGDEDLLARQHGRGR